MKTNLEKLIDLLAALGHANPHVQAERSGSGYKIRCGHAPDDLVVEGATIEEAAAKRLESLRERAARYRHTISVSLDAIDRVFPKD